MRILTKFDIRNGNIVKGINYEGVEKVGPSSNIYIKICNYISKNVNKNFEIILNDVTASLYNIKSGEDDIKNILHNKSFSLPHIYSGGINTIQEVKNKLNMGCDRIMINTALHDDTNLITEIINIYGAQILIPTIETRLINSEYYVFKNYGREDTNTKLVDWINMLYKKGIVEILIISIDSDGTGNGYDKILLQYMKQKILSGILSTNINYLYAGGIKDIKQINEIEQHYPFITGVSISKLFYNSIKNIYFLSYLEGNSISVQKHFSLDHNCIVVNSIKKVPIDETLCISGHYNSYNQIKQLKKQKDYSILKDRLTNKTINYIGICSGLQILLNEIEDENNFFGDKEQGLNILPFTLNQLDKPEIGFINGNFYCHKYEVIDSSNNRINKYIKDNIEAYQYHPENSL